MNAQTMWQNDSCWWIRIERKHLAVAWGRHPENSQIPSFFNSTIRTKFNQEGTKDGWPVIFLRAPFQTHFCGILFLLSLFLIHLCWSNKSKELRITRRCSPQNCDETSSAQQVDSASANLTVDMKVEESAHGFWWWFDLAQVATWVNLNAGERDDWWRGKHGASWPNSGAPSEAKSAVAKSVACAVFVTAGRLSMSKCFIAAACRGLGPACILDLPSNQQQQKVKVYRDPLLKML